MIVLDASAALEIARGSKTGQAFLSFFLPEEEIIAPDLFAVEVSNAAWKYVHAGILSKQEGKHLREDALELVDEICPTAKLLDEVFSQAVHFDHSVYDMVYLVLARRFDATLVTSDKKLRKLCEENGVDCVCEVNLSHE